MNANAICLNNRILKSKTQLSRFKRMTMLRKLGRIKGMQIVAVRNSVGDLRYLEEV